MNDWYGYFRENMTALHLPAPRSLFATAKQAKETISAIAGAIRAFGTKATLGEIIGTIPSLGAAGDLLTLGSAISASFYVGACIGSVAVATGRTVSGGKQIADFFEVGRQAVSDVPLLRQSYQEYHRAGGRLR
jgi:hypothetical protein